MAKKKVKIDKSTLSKLNYQDGGGIISKIKNTKLNPKNWGVKDYTDKGEFSSAHSSARQAGEKEFMWSGKRYNTNYSGTPEQQLRETGITDERITGRNLIKDRVVDNVNPHSYGHVKEAIKAMLTNTPEIWKDHVDYNQQYKKTQGDALRLVMGRPQIHDSFKVSKHKPTSVKKGNVDVYYALNNSSIETELLYKVYQLNKREIEKKRQVVTSLGSSDAALGDYTIDFGSDDKGDYISIYDINDYSPLGNYGDQTKLQTKIKNPIGKPFEIYDRVYYRFRENSQYPEKVYYSDKELSELDADKKNFDTLALQRELKNRGYELPKSTKKDGSLDGVLGEETKQALTDWKNKNNDTIMKTNKKIDKSTLSKLNYQGGGEITSMTTRVPKKVTDLVNTGTETTTNVELPAYTKIAKRYGYYIPTSAKNQGAEVGTKGYNLEATTDDGVRHIYNPEEAKKYFPKINFDKLPNLKYGGMVKGKNKADGGFLKNLTSGVSTGASVGSAFGPGPGTAIGAVTGGLLGTVQGLIGMKEKAKQAKIEEMDWREGIASYHKGIRAMNSYKEGGKIKGEGTGKSDDIPMKAEEGSFVVPAENNQRAIEIGKEYLGWDDQTLAKRNYGQSGEDINVSNGEVIFTPTEVGLLDYYGIDYRSLAPNAEQSIDMQEGGDVSKTDRSKVDKIKKYYSTLDYDYLNKIKSPRKYYDVKVVKPELRGQDIPDSEYSMPSNFRVKPFLAGLDIFRLSPVSGFKRGMSEATPEFKSAIDELINEKNPMKYKKTLEKLSYQDGGDVKKKTVEYSPDKPIPDTLPKTNPYLQSAGEVMQKMIMGKQKGEDDKSVIDYIPEIAGTLQALGGAFGLIKEGASPTVQVSDALKKLSSEVRQMANYGYEPKVINALNRQVDTAYKDMTNVIVGKGGSPMEIMAKLQNTLGTTLDKKADILYADAVEKARKYTDVIRVDMAKAGQEFDVSRLNLEDYYKKQEAYGSLLSAGISNTIGARKYKATLDAIQKAGNTNLTIQ